MLETELITCYDCGLATTIVSCSRAWQLVVLWALFQIDSKRTVIGLDGPMVVAGDQLIDLWFLLLWEKWTFSARALVASDH